MVWLGQEGPLLDTSTITSGWLKRCNLAVPGRMGRDVPREVMIYLVVTYAKHPTRLPAEIASFVASCIVAQDAIGEA